jgi:hypothetical protein
MTMMGAPTVFGTNQDSNNFLACLSQLTGLAADKSF